MAFRQQNARTHDDNRQAMALVVARQAAHGRRSTLGAGPAVASPSAAEEMRGHLLSSTGSWPQIRLKPSFRFSLFGLSTPSIGSDK